MLFACHSLTLSHTKYMHTHSVIQPFLTLCNPIDYNLPGCSVHRISQASYWSRVPFPNQYDLPHPGIKPRSVVSPAMTGRLFLQCSTWEVLFLLEVTTKQETESSLDLFPYWCVYVLDVIIFHCFSVPCEWTLELFKIAYH